VYRQRKEEAGLVLSSDVLNSLVHSTAQTSSNDSDSEAYGTRRTGTNPLVVYQYLYRYRRIDTTNDFGALVVESDV
jgi:hypothetical protein